MKSIISIFILLLTFSSISFAQESSISDEEYRDIKLSPPNYTGVRGQNRPEKFSLKAFCPKPVSYPIASGVGITLGYYAMTTMYAKREGWSQKEINDLAFSSFFIYNQVKESGGCASGANVKDALDLLKNKGNLLATQFDDKRTDCDKKPESIELQNAKQWKIESYVRLFEKEDEEGYKRSQIKKSLLQNKPPIVILYPRKNFESLTQGTYDPKVGDTSPLPKKGGYTLMVIGYDEPNKTFELIATKGTAWGNEGFFKMSYDNFSKYIKMAFQMTINENKPNDKEKTFAAVAPKMPKTITQKPSTSTGSHAPYSLKGDYSIHQITYKKGQSIIRRLKPLQKNIDESYLYVLNEKYKVGDEFRLILDNQYGDRYLYVFSLNDKGTNYINFPSDENISALIGEGELHVPGISTNIAVDEYTKDYLCAIYSHEPLTITEIQRRITFAKSYNESVHKNIYNAFSDLVYHPNNVIYFPDKMEFKVMSKKQKAVLMILEIDSTK